MAQLAVNGGRPVFVGEFPAWPVVDDADRAALTGVLDSGVWGIGGTQQGAFEKEWASFVGSRHAVLTSSGSTALMSALRACGVEPGDEVIIPAYTFQATATAVLYLGAVPIFADIEAGGLCLDPDAVEAAITSRTRVIMPVHVAGRPADMDRFTFLAEKHGLSLIEDACQAHGAAWRDRRVGSIGQAGAFSFQSTKNLCAGEGGIVTTSDPRVAGLANAVHNCGSAGAGLTAEPTVGTNYRMTEFQAALLRSQMRRLPDQIRVREANARTLDQELAKIPGMMPLSRDERITTHAHHLYVFRYDSRACGVPRRSFLRALNGEGIPCHGGYEPLYRAPFLSEGLNAFPHARTGPRYPNLDLPVTETACHEAVWLTQRLLLSSPDRIQAIIDAVAKVYEYRGELKDD